MTLYIGDVHGLYKSYKRIIENCQSSIQVGDMGVGFKERSQIDSGLYWSINPPYDIMKDGGHRFIRGNHDNPEVCAKHSQWICDGTVEDNKMFVGGALSIDKEWRTEGIDWWANEELDYKNFERIIDLYDKTRPEIMVTHECPESVAAAMCQHTGRTKFDMKSITRQAFDSMWNMHSPQVWIFGHYHFSFDQVLNGTRFVCLDELETKEIEL